MEHNEGREASDAELLKQMAQNAEDQGPWADWTRFVDQAVQRGCEYLSGTRPLPTADEDANTLREMLHFARIANTNLTARVAELEAGLLDLYEATGAAGAHIPDAQHASVAQAAALLSTITQPQVGPEGGAK